MAPNGSVDVGGVGTEQECTIRRATRHTRRDCRKPTGHSRTEGTGLGLYVSHGIAERHGGELVAENAEGGGAIFSLKIPLTCYNTMEMAG